MYTVIGFPKYNRAQFALWHPRHPRSSSQATCLCIKMADIVEGDKYWMELAENGTQPDVQGHIKPEELFRKLKSGKPKQWEAVFKQ